MCSYPVAMDISSEGDATPSVCGSAHAELPDIHHDPEFIDVIRVDSDSEAEIAPPSVVDDQDLHFSISDTEDIHQDQIHQENESQREDFMEIFSRPRLIPRILFLKLCMVATLSIDILTGYDLLLAAKRREVMRHLWTKRPRSVMLSPPCTMFSQLMNTNWARMDPVVVKKRWREAMVLLKFALEVAKFVMSYGGFFVLEHPSGASSWRLPDLKPFLETPGVHLVTFHQCRFGLRAPISGLPIRKSTRFLTNSLSVAKRFNHVFCTCSGPHKTIQGSEGPYKLSKFCEQYPEPLCDAVLLALKDELRA